MPTRTCPRCRVISESTAAVCDCGYAFATGRALPRPAPLPGSSTESALSIAEEYRSLVRIVLLQGGIGVATRLASYAARRAGSDGLVTAVNIAGLAMVLTLVVLIAQRTFRVARAMGSPSARAWAATVGALGFFGLLAFRSQGRRWSVEQRIKFGFLGPLVRSTPRAPMAVEYGALWRRAIALGVDMVLAIVIGFAFFFAAGFLDDPVGVVNHYTPFLESFWGLALGVFIYALFEGSRLRGTPGKWLAGIAVEDARGVGEGVSFLAAVWRNIAKHGSGFIFPVSLLMAGLTRQKRAPHDFLARSVVVRRRRDASEITACAATFVTCAVLFLASLVVWQHSGRGGMDKARIGAAARRAFPMELKSLPSVNPETLFTETHARCFERHYKQNWTGNTFDRSQYLGCMDAAYAARFAEAVVLDGVDFEPHAVNGESDPRWAKAVIRGRVTEGVLGDSLILQKETRCEGQGEGYSSNDSSLKGRELELAADGGFRFSTLAGLQTRPCRWTLYLMLGRIRYGKPLIVDLPLADPVRIAEQEERHRAYLAALAEAKACRARTAPSLEALRTLETSRELSTLLRDLSNSDRTLAGRAMAELIRLGPSARSAIPVLVPRLEDRGYEGQSAARALAALDPDGTTVTPILLCQLAEPDPEWKYAAAGALLRVGNRQGLDALAQGLKDPSGRHRFTVVSEIEKSGAKAAPLLSLVIECARTRTEARERGECLNALPRMDPADRNALRALQDAAEDDVDPATRERATSALRYAEDLRYRDASKTPEAAARCLASDPSADLRLRCLYVATSSRPFGTAAAAALRKALSDPDSRVREAARQVMTNPS